MRYGSCVPESEQKAGITNYVMGLSFITEGAIVGCAILSVLKKPLSENA